MLTASDAATVATYVDLGYDEQTIKEIINVLDSSSDDLQSSKVPPTADGSYGASPSGVELARNAALARQKVIDAIRDMAAGLQGYRDSVDMFHLRAQAVDQDAHAAAVSLNKATECVAQPTLGSPSQCTLPNPSGSGDQ